MISTIVSIIAVVFFLRIVQTYRIFTRNLAAAKSSGIPYVIVPIYLYSLTWGVLQKPVAPYLRMLPSCLTDPWLDLIFDDWWTHQYGTFKKVGHDTFLTVAPGGNILHSVDAMVINQLTSRPRDFPKPLKLYEGLSIYGPNVLTTEGNVWRRHRKITSVPFNEKSNHMVFVESLRQAKAMTDDWIGAKEESPPIYTVAKDTWRLSLYVISLAGFGKRLSGPDGETAEEESTHLEDGKGHQLSYTKALTVLLESIIWLFIFPTATLKYLPLKKPQAAYQAYVEWGKYLDEMFQSKKEELAAGKSQEGLDLMGAMIGASLTTESNHESSGPNPPAQRILSDLEIIGNAFLFILGGHATTADSIHFSLIYLALRPSTQRRLQADLDHVFDSRPVSEWEYERDIKHLFSGVCGAVLAEQLRLIPPVVDIVKWNPVNAPPMPLTVDGKTCHVPPNTLIRISASGTHRNPNFWPSGPPADPAHPVHPTSNTDNDLEEFKPERWFLPPPGGDSESARILSPSLDGTLSQETTPDTSSALFRPARGSYIPFSDGQRACLGRRFGQVEVFAVLALIFKEYSVELAVDQIIHSSSEKCMRRPDEGVDGVGGKAGKADGMEEEAEKREAWERAAAEVRRMLRDDMVYSLTLQLDNKKVPLRLVRRGKERYWW